MYKETSWHTKTDSIFNSYQSNKEFIVRRSSVENIFAVLLGTTGSIFISYTLLSTNIESPIILSVIIIAFFTVFTIFSIKGIFDNTIHIRINKDGILLDENEMITWPLITNTIIVKKAFFFTRGRGPTIERFYLKIETIYSGQASKRRTGKLFQLTGMNHSVKEIEHYIEYFKQQSLSNKILQ